MCQPGITAAAARLLLEQYMHATLPPGCTVPYLLCAARPACDSRLSVSKMSNTLQASEGVASSVQAAEQLRGRLPSAHTLASSRAAPLSSAWICG